MLISYGGVSRKVSVFLGGMVYHFLKNPFIKRGQWDGKTESPGTTFRTKLVVIGESNASRTGTPAYPLPVPPGLPGRKTEGNHGMTVGQEGEGKLKTSQQVLGGKLKYCLEMCIPSLFVVFLNWSIVDLQCCVSFRCTAKCVYIHIYTQIYIHMHTHTCMYVCV